MIQKISNIATGEVYHVDKKTIDIISKSKSFERTFKIHKSELPEELKKETKKSAAKHEPIIEPKQTENVKNTKGDIKSD